MDGRMDGRTWNQYTPFQIHWSRRYKNDDSGTLLSGVPDYFGRNKISSGGDLSHYSSASLY